MFRFRSAVIAAAAALALVGVAAQPAQAGPNTPNKGRYAAIGDSYAAGFGSPVAYPVLLADGANKVTLLAVSGATTETVMAQQVPHIPRGVSQVTITAGGNDVGFGLVAAACTLNSPDADACGAAIVAATAKFPAMATNLSALIEQVREQAPRAAIYVTGYPILLQAPGVVCPVDLSSFDAANAQLNAVIEQVALGNGATYVDVADDFVGHGLCHGPESWIIDSGPAVLHPTEEGQKAYADAVEATSFTSAAESSRRPVRRTVQSTVTSDRP